MPAPDVRFQILVAIVIGEHVIALGTLFVQPDPSAHALDQVIFDFHSDRARDPSTFNDH
jgi:hypothetical protein